MTVFVALLRSVNVGGKAQLAMADLRRIAAECGFESVRTYVQSGNVVFRAAEGGKKVTSKLRAAIRSATGLDIEIAVRTRDELAAVVERNPFIDRAQDTSHLHLVFLMDSAEADALEDFDAAPFAPDEVAAVGREAYLHLPNGMGRSKLAAALGRRRNAVGTARNWRTVTKLLAMADEATATT
jgi:uncharacterized protein (DUF1697 family)